MTILFYEQKNGETLVPVFVFFVNGIYCLHSHWEGKEICDTDHVRITLNLDELGRR